MSFVGSLLFLGIGLFGTGIGVALFSVSWPVLVSLLGWWTIIAAFMIDEATHK